MPVYTDQTNAPSLLPEGDFIFEVTKFECGISNGWKTSGSDKYEVTVKIEQHGNTIKENLTDHPSCAWKIDCFVKCCGVTIAKGERFEFRQDLAQANDCRWVNPIGLRGWCRIIQESYQRKDGKPGTANRIAVFYTDKEKLAPVVQPEPEDF